VATSTQQYDHQHLHFWRLCSIAIYINLTYGTTFIIMYVISTALVKASFSTFIISPAETLLFEKPTEKPSIATRLLRRKTVMETMKDIIFVLGCKISKFKRSYDVVGERRQTQVCTHLVTIMSSANSASSFLRT
jgi:hypothetical protein